MLFVESMISESHIDDALRLPLLGRLQERGLVPLIRSTRLYSYETALHGADRAGEMEQSMAAKAAAEADSTYVRGDIFCFEDFVLFLIFSEEEPAREGLLRAGIVYEAAAVSDARKELDAFCRNVSEALILVSDVATNNYLSEPIEWQRRVPKEMPALNDSASANNFANAPGTVAAAKHQEVTVEASRAAEVLEDAGARRLLRRIREAHADGNIPDLLASLKGKTETEALMSRLAESGLLRREVVISCRQVEHSLFRLPSTEALAVITASHASCSECGADIADEKIEELVVPTDVAAALLEDGSWLSSRLRLVLQQLGVSEEHLTAGSISVTGEAYLMVSVCREPFLFFLKDGDVTATHARHALGKLNETDAPHLVVVATGKIQDDARTRLREHARRRARNESRCEVLLIEGVETAANELQQAFERVSHCALVEELSPLDASLGLSVGSLLTNRFRLMQRADALTDLAASAVGALSKSLPEF